MDLFDYSIKEQLKKDAPLADRMRPQTLDQFIGQSHILSPGKLLRRAIQADQLSSLIFFGPPGTGKTTLARIIANTTKAEFISLNAVLSGVKDIRSSIATAEKFRKEYERKTILFIDEVHRFNKAQQDALLPHVENGTVILIGATTENPYFEVNKALVSRSRIFQLESLKAEDLGQILDMALNDKERGYGAKKINIDENARKHLANVANGDARAILNALELAVETSEANETGVIHIDLNTAEESIQKKAVLYDKDGDAHFDTISAFIKSLRGSDPDAALYWMAKMIYGGEEPRFLFRRMIVFAGEDVGMADPHALQVVMSAAQAFDYVGMPEGRFHLAQACLYLSTAPKSNSGFAFFDALKTIQQEQNGEIPNPIKDGNRDKDGFGHGKGYLYPHAYKDHWVAQQYLPDDLQGRAFYQPSNQGYEARVKDDVARRREIQLAAFLDSSEQSAESQAEYWQERTFSNTAELLSQLRDYTFSQVEIKRHQLILVLNAGDGIFLGEALRKAEEGTVYGLVNRDAEKNLLENRYAELDYLQKPVILSVGKNSEGLMDLGDLIKEKIKFDTILGKNALNNMAQLRQLRQMIAPGGNLVLVESIPSQGQRLSGYLPENSISRALLKKLLKAESRIYEIESDDKRQPKAVDLSEMLNREGFKSAFSKQTDFFNRTIISKKRITDWFSLESTSRKTYARYLTEELSLDEIEEIKTLLLNVVAGRVVEWKSSWLFVKAVQQP
ncbi:AAA family ATPase [bacterium]|nr:AAA family ATPase [bacterium]